MKRLGDVLRCLMSAGWLLVTVGVRGSAPQGVLMVQENAWVWH